MGPWTYNITSYSNTPEIAPAKQPSVQPMSIAIVSSGQLRLGLLGNTLVHILEELSQILVCLVQVGIIIPNIKEQNFFGFSKHLFSFLLAS